MELVHRKRNAKKITEKYEKPILQNSLETKGMEPGMDLKDKIILFCLFLAFAACLFSLYACLFHFKLFHLILVKGFAHWGNSNFQHLLGEKFLYGMGIDKNETLAMSWFRKAADQGHPHSSYNLAIGHLKGFDTDVIPGEPHKLIQHAANKGLPEAIETLETACKVGKCF